jgi:hypothetical protein
MSKTARKRRQRLIARGYLPNLKQNKRIIRTKLGYAALAEVIVTEQRKKMKAKAVAVAFVLPPDLPEPEPIDPRTIEAVELKSKLTKLFDHRRKIGFGATRRRNAPSWIGGEVKKFSTRLRELKIV